jgi:predicted glycosyltransferase
MRPPRIAIYSQDGMGLGHQRRTSSIASGLLGACPDAAVLTLSDSPLGPYFRAGAHHDYVKLPSIASSGPGQWRPVALPLPFAEVHRLRSDIIGAAVAGFAPDLLLVDHMPHGARGELLPTLAALAEAGAPTRVVLGLRDIVGAAPVISERWQVEGAYDALDRFYDAVLVFGEQRLFDVAAQYALCGATAARLRYCGFVCPPTAPRYTARARTQCLGRRPAHQLLVAFAGGGADGYPLMRTVLDALPMVDAVQPCVALLVVGPFMPAEQRRDLETRAARLANARALVRISVNDPLSYIEAADVVVAMAGYNTSVEALRWAKRAILVPRSGPSAEQRMRAQVFAAQGWVGRLEPEELDADRLSSAVLERLAEPAYGAASSPCRTPPDLGGLDRAVKELLGVLPANTRWPTPPPRRAVEDGRA